MPTACRVLNADAHFPEGPIWYHGKLYYVEYDRNSVTAWDGSKNTIFWSQKGCGPSAVIATARGEFLTTCYDNGTIGRISAEGKRFPPIRRTRTATPVRGPERLCARTRHGGIYFTASGHPGTAIDGKVFYLAADGTVEQEADERSRAPTVSRSRRTARSSTSSRPKDIG